MLYAQHAIEGAVQRRQQKQKELFRQIEQLEAFKHEWRQIISSVEEMVTFTRPVS